MRTGSARRNTYKIGGNKLNETKDQMTTFRTSVGDDVLRSNSGEVIRNVGHFEID